MPPKDPTIEEAKAFRGRTRRNEAQSAPPMTLGNMRANGIHCLSVYCRSCHHQVHFNVDHMPDHVAVPSIGRRMVCTRCGLVGADARPDWNELKRSAKR
jgi:hypothetical protein